MKNSSPSTTERLLQYTITSYHQLYNWTSTDRAIEEIEDPPTTNVAIHYYRVLKTHLARKQMGTQQRQRQQRSDQQINWHSYALMNEAPMFISQPYSPSSIYSPRPQSATPPTTLSWNQCHHAYIDSNRLLIILNNLFESISNFTSIRGYYLHIIFSPVVGYVLFIIIIF